MIKIPTLEGIIERRILLNFAIDKQVLEKIIPAPFKPKLISDKGIGGICLIRLKHIRPKGFPKLFSIDSENAAHRFAVEWIENGIKKEGVYIPRRDTNSTVNHLTGGRLFPGIHHKAKFEVLEQGNHYKIDIRSTDGMTLSVSAETATGLNKDSVFADLETASSFFRNGSVGFSPNDKSYDGIELKIKRWEVTPLLVQNIQSSFFNDETLFPKGAISFDNALLMKNVRHDWVAFNGSPY